MKGTDFEALLPSYIVALLSAVTLFGFPLDNRAQVIVLSALAIGVSALGSQALITVQAFDQPKQFRFRYWTLHALYVVGGVTVIIAVSAVLKIGLFF